MNNFAVLRFTSCEISRMQTNFSTEISHTEIKAKLKFICK